MAKEAKPEPRKHHYVPQFYLRGFVGDKKQLFVVDRPSEKTFRTPPLNVAAERDFNRVEVEGIDPAAVEKTVSEFEGKAAPALERIKEAKSLANREDRETLMRLIGALAVRNPRQRASINDFLTELAEKIAQMALETEERWVGQVEQMKKAGVWDESTNVSYADMKKFIENRNYKIKVAKEFNIALELDYQNGLLQHLSERKWQLLVARDNSGGFVTTDVPVCLHWSDGKDHGVYSAGFGLKGTEVLFPLSTKLCLRGTFEGEENVVDADLFLVGAVNSYLISNAEKQVYAHDFSFNYMKGGLQEIGSGATLVQDKIFLDAGKEPQQGNVVALKAV